MEERGPRHREETPSQREGPRHIFVPKHEHKAAEDPAQSILNLGFLLPSLERT